MCTLAVGGLVGRWAGPWAGAPEMGGALTPDSPRGARALDDTANRPGPGSLTAVQADSAPPDAAAPQPPGPSSKTITIYIEPAKTRSTLFLTGRLVRYSSGQYSYRKVILNRKLAGNVTQFRHQTCVLDTGYKFFVGHGELVLRNWPGNAVWSVTGDEAGDWGLKRNGKYFGLHGPGSLFPTNESDPRGPIMLPDHAKLRFRQYYDAKQVGAFGDDVRYLPLGSRLEFPDLDPRQHVVAPQRTFVYSYMVSITDPSRRRLRDVLQADRRIARDRAYVHVSEGWHSSANHAEYVTPAKYAAIMQDSVFVLCPKGHSVEQFRLYEAIEAGAIPVLEDTAVARSTLPPEYFSSGMLFVTDWADAPEAMLASLADPAAVTARQTALVAWYERFMRDKLREIEVALESIRDPQAGSVCGGTAGT